MASDQSIPDETNAQTIARRGLAEKARREKVRCNTAREDAGEPALQHGATSERTG
jgi:hypothetical protein